MDKDRSSHGTMAQNKLSIPQLFVCEIVILFLFFFYRDLKSLKVERKNIGSKWGMDLPRSVEATGPA